MIDPLTYDDLKELAEDSDRPLLTLVALSKHSDPFIAGLPSRKEWAEWFTALWRRFSFASRAHIRRVHYRLISTGEADPVLMPNGEAYENTDKCWKHLIAASRDARYLGLIDARDLDDRRNDEAIINFDGEETEAIIGTTGGLNEYAPPSFEIPKLGYEAPQIAQRYTVEIWIEKSTMNDIILPLAERYGVNVVSGTGETSLTRCIQLVDRSAAEDRPVRILYISDFDPGGMSMPVAAARKIEFLMRKEEHDADVQLRPIALTEDQCRRYRLPRTPIKEDEGRGATFEARFGSGATELDALEALHPGELARILEREIERYYDDELGGQIEQASDDVQSELDRINDEVHERHAEAIAELEEEHEKVLAAVTAFEAKARPILQEIERNLQGEAPEAGGFDWPDPDDFEGEEDDNSLYDSSRDYVEQMDRYKEHQDKPTERKTFDRVCEHCGTAFTSKRSNARFCTHKCRSDWGYAHRDTAKQDKGEVI